MIASATATGLVDLVAPDLGKITPRAMAAGLAKLHRWGGNTTVPITVAQHSVLVRDIFLRRNPDLRSAAIYPLLHDGHEYLLGDLIAPLEKLLEERIPGFSRHVEAVKLSIDHAIRTAWNIPHPSVEIVAAVNEADIMAASLEWRIYMPIECGDSPYTRPPSSQGFRALPWTQAEELFLQNLIGELAARNWEMAA